MLARQALYHLKYVNYIQFSSELHITTSWFLLILIQFIFTLACILKIGITQLKIISSFELIPCFQIEVHSN
jgi:hypothetical protein